MTYTLVIDGGSQPKPIWKTEPVKSISEAEDIAADYLGQDCEIFVLDESDSVAKVIQKSLDPIVKTDSNTDQTPTQ